MTVKERVMTSRLIQKIDSNGQYARRIGLSYRLEVINRKVDSSDTIRQRKQNTSHAITHGNRRKSY